MKVLHINSSLSGGAGHAAIRLHKALLAQGIESKFLVIDNSEMSIPGTYSFVPGSRSFFQSFLYKLARRMGYARNYWEKYNRLLGDRDEGLEFFTFPYSDYDITTQSIYKEADVINIHWTTGFLDFNFFRKNTKPVVWTLHDMFPFTGGCHYSHGCDGFASDCSDCPQLKGLKSVNYASQNLRYKKECTRDSNISFVFLSDKIGVDIGRSQLFGGNERFKILNSIDVDYYKVYPREFSRSVFNLPLNRKIFLFVSENLSQKRKGISFILKCIERTKDKDVIFCGVGANQDIFKKYPNVKSLGYVNDQRLMPLLYNAADAVVLPSLEDNLPNVMLESLACGTPVIGFPVGGIKDIIEHEVTGLLTNEIDEEELMQSLLKFVERPDQYNRDTISNNARKLFSPEKQAKEYIEVYNNSLDIR